ncbi:MAG: endonuclease III [Actinomycetota bacterium]
MSSCTMDQGYPWESLVFGVMVAKGTVTQRRARAAEVLARLKQMYPEAVCELTHNNAFQLLTATILSAQCTDVRVNMVTPALFAEFPTAELLAGADIGRVEELVRSTGFYQTKAKNLIGMAHGIVDRFGGEVPSDLDDLITLPGVGRKTANVVRSVAFKLPGLPVDTHVGRLSRRLGLTSQEDAVKVEHDLAAMLPPTEWGEFSLRLILHGRRVCDAKKPRCGECDLADICPSSELPRVKMARSVGSRSKKTACAKKRRSSTR